MDRTLAVGKDAKANCSQPNPQAHKPTSCLCATLSLSMSVSMSVCRFSNRI